VNTFFNTFICQKSDTCKPKYQIVCTLRIKFMGAK
jgi:hypothetical protein